jgi:2'-5' RNA ligase
VRPRSRARLGLALAGAAGQATACRSHALPPEGPGAATLISAVVRVPAPLAATLAAAAAQLATLDPRHHPYPPESVHVTVLALRGDLDATGPVAGVAARHAPFALDLNGLVLAPGSVLARALPGDGALLALRRELASLAESRRRAPGVQWLALHAAHATLVRLGGPASPALGRAVHGQRRRPFGTLEVAELEVVRSDRLLSPDATQVLGVAPLGADQANASPTST